MFYNNETEATSRMSTTLWTSPWLQLSSHLAQLSQTTHSQHHQNTRDTAFVLRGLISPADMKSTFGFYPSTEDTSSLKRPNSQSREMVWKQCLHPTWFPAMVPSALPSALDYFYSSLSANTSSFSSHHQKQKAVLTS